MFKAYQKEHLRRQVADAAENNPSEHAFIDGLGEIMMKDGFSEEDIASVIKLWHYNAIFQLATVDIELAVAVLPALVRYGEDPSHMDGLLYSHIDGIVAYIKGYEKLGMSKSINTEHDTKWIIQQLWTHAHLEGEEEAETLREAFSTVIGHDQW